MISTVTWWAIRRMRRLGCGWAWALLLCSIPLLLAAHRCPVPPPEYANRWSPAGQRRVDAMRPWTQLLSRAYRLDAREFEAVAALETGRQGLRGGIDSGCFGPGQVQSLLLKSQ